MLDLWSLTRPVAEGGRRPNISASCAPPSAGGLARRPVRGLLEVAAEPRHRHRGSTRRPRRLPQRREPRGGGGWGCASDWCIGLPLKGRRLFLLHLSFNYSIRPRRVVKVMSAGLSLGRERPMYPSLPTLAACMHVVLPVASGHLPLNK